MDNIIDGKSIACDLLLDLTAQIETIAVRYEIVPTIAIILVGHDQASTIYVNNKIKAAEKVGMRVNLVRIPIEVDSAALLEQVKRLNNDMEVSGIIVQLPLPAHIDKDLIIASIDPRKDVDGFHPLNVGYLHSGVNHGFVPCTALGCLHLIKAYEPCLKGKKVAIIGRSNIVGKPLSALLLQENCTVTLCHSYTVGLSQITTKADIVVSAMGVPKMLGIEYFNQNSIVIDVGITRMPFEEGIVGDVDFERVKNTVKYITPVPGGVGPMTVAFLLKNTFKACLEQHKIMNYYA